MHKGSDFIVQRRCFYSPDEGLYVLGEGVYDPAKETAIRTIGLAGIGSIWDECKKKIDCLTTTNLFLTLII